MSNQFFRLVDPKPVLPRGVVHAKKPKLLGRILVEIGAITTEDLRQARSLQKRHDTLLGELLLAHRLITEEQLFQALSIQFRANIVDIDKKPPDPRLIDVLGTDDCLRHALLPLCRIGALTVIATSNPHAFAKHLARLQDAFGPITMALVPTSQLHRAIQQGRPVQLVDQAENRVQDINSCRDWNGWRIARPVLWLAPIWMPLMYFAANAVVAALSIWALLTLALIVGLKLATGLAALLTLRKPTAPRERIVKYPVISVIVPLLREREIAAHLIQRLARLDYPREALDICLVVEQNDVVTQQTLAHTRLPQWMRTLVVPKGTLKTKPRALNYALDFCRGEIVGIYDAEDAPDPGQLKHVVRHFQSAPDDVVCLQGILDFYNAGQNWLSRCFTIEYATWFRMVLPGLQRLGMPVPLGGTTLFFRRHILEELGRWDAHNVTEDADLGIRLARRGYKTELIQTVTREEANCRPWPWIKQRSRWLKGYAITYAVHMRRPVQLWRDLGGKGFLGFQIMFLCALSQYALAPLLWSFWLIPLGFWHPVEAVLPPVVLVMAAAIFLITEAINIGMASYAISRTQHRSLIFWVPTLHVYFPLGALAIYKGLWEMITKPFYWDKTDHGFYQTNFTQLPETRPRPISIGPETPAICGPSEHDMRPLHPLFRSHER